MEREHFLTKTTTFVIAGTLFIQSQKHINSVVEFLIKIFEDLRFEMYHVGIRCYISSLSKKRITKLGLWSKIEEVVRYLSVMELNNKKFVLQEQVTPMATKTVGNPFMDTN